MNTITKAIMIFGAIALIISLITFDWDLGLIDIVALLTAVYGRQLPLGNIIQWIGVAIVAIVSSIIIILTLLVIGILVGL
jgi:hypothetical protein